MQSVGFLAYWAILLLTLLCLQYRFLQEQYYRYFPDCAEKAFLCYVGVLSAESNDQIAAVDIPRGAAIGAVKNRLEMFLGVLSVVTNPRQLFKSQQLFFLYTALLLKPDATVAKLCLDCLFAFKIEYLTPYKQNLINLVEDKSFRDELIAFNVAARGGNIEPVHRKPFIYVLQFVVFGRMMAKVVGNRSRDQKHSRRIAFLHFLSALPSDELRPFVVQMVQTVIPVPHLLALQGKLTSSKPSSSASASASFDLVVHYDQWYAGVDDIIAHLIPEDFKKVVVEKQVGFLNLMATVVHSVALGLTPYISTLASVVARILKHAQQERHGKNNECDPSS
jgi:U3 small nucleolar RNA-associated protein 20